MTRINLGTLALGAASVVAFVAAIACELDYQRYPEQLAGLTPLRVSMAGADTVRGSFTAVWSEPHYVALVFPGSVDTEIAAALHHAA